MRGVPCPVVKVKRRDQEVIESVARCRVLSWEENRNAENVGA